MPTPEPTPTTLPLSPEAQAALTYLAEQKQIPRDQLVVTSEEVRDFPLLDRRYVLVTVLHDQASAPQSYRVLVDPTSQAVEPDIDGILVAEQAAAQEKYGKFDPPLYDKLQSSEDNEAIPVVIWAAETDEEDSVKAAELEVAQLYPEAAKALAERGVAWAVDDEALRLEIKQKFAELLAERSARRIQPIVMWLEEKGYRVEKIEGSPIVAATLSKQDILTLAELTFVAQIQLGGGEPADSSTISIPTSRVPVVWSRGMTGSGVRLAIVETGKINNTARNCLNVIATRDNTVPDDDHISIVSAIASCNDMTKRGVAYNAQILDAGYSLSGDMVTAAQALNWAVAQNSADVTNESERFLGQQLDTNLYYLDMFYDYLVKAYDFTAVIAAGNKDFSNNVGTPGKGWNVITVGNSEDQNTASWADDKINESAIGSSYENPSTTVEKPEVAAPGTNIDTVAGERTGTSLSAPHVAGLAALLMQRKPVLKNYPSAVKAIIMASAVENTEGDKRLSGKDGAGAVDAALADSIAQTQGNPGTCNGPCWWYIPINDSNLPEPPQGSSNFLYHTFNATRGERIRVVISWLSSAAADGTLDQLRTELNLHVRRPNATTIASSTSSANGFEIVDFIADAAGTYTIAVERLYSSVHNESDNALGIAWVKQATYLPDLRNNNGSWTSSIYVRNDAPLLRSARITFFDTDGDYKTESNTNLQPNALWLPVPPANWQGTAIVDGSEDLSVVVRNDAAGQATFDNAFLAAGTVDPAFAQPATTLYAPVIYANIFGGLNSAIYLQNPNKDPAEVDLNLIGRVGYSNYSLVEFTLPANGSTTYLVGGSGWVGSLKISADRPVVAKITESQGSTVMRSYNATAIGHKLTYVAAVYKSSLGFSSSGLVIQNLHATSDTTAKVTYCNRASTPVCYEETTPTIPGERAYGINVATTTAIPTSEAMWNGSVKIESQNNLPLAVAVTNAKSNGGYDISGVNLGSQSIILPRAVKSPVGGRNTGFTVRNVTNENNVSVAVTHYDTDGNPRCPFSFSLNAKQSAGYYQGDNTCLPANWEGSIVLEATRPVIAIMREDTTDSTAGYNGVGR